MIFTSVVLLGTLIHSSEVSQSADLIVYGGTSAAISSAVQAKKMGRSVIVVSPDKHLGGLSSGGLGFTDTGNKAVIGGIARDFYHRIWKHYNQSSAWKWQKKESYGNKGQGTPAVDGEQRTMWIFEPHAAELVFEDMVREFKIPVFREEYLDRKSGVVKNQGKIVSMKTLSGKVFQGKMFIDATYEGDLMASAGVEYHVGRESQAKYGEKWNGVQTGVLHHGHHFGNMKISPYKIPGDSTSGLLPKISKEAPGEFGQEDKRLQAYCFRMCLTNHEENRLAFQKPDGYDPADYELLLRVFQKGWKETFHKFDPIPNFKTDTNNHGPFSTDNIGMNYDYPEANYERRREIIKEHERYQKGWLYFIANDPRVPEAIQMEMKKWGLAKDEFKDNGNWPHQLYIREARRMIGSFVMTENELLGRKPTPDSIGMGSYTMDSHNVQRYVTPDGFVQNEGDIGAGLKPYQIALGSILPKKNQCENLLVPVCVSSSHIAFGSIRMEPVFMILGQSAAITASLALDSQKAIQDVPYPLIKAKLLEDGQVLEYQSSGSSNSQGVPLKELKGIVLDNQQAKLKGDWKPSSTNGNFVGEGYIHDANSKNGTMSATFNFKAPEAGTYEVRLSYPPNNNRSTRVRVEILSPMGAKVVLVNQRQKPPLEGLFTSLVKLDCQKDQEIVVAITNADSDGFVVVDAVQMLKAK